MAAITTGDMYTNEEVFKMTEEQKKNLGIVPITPEESEMLSKMNRKNRRVWLARHKK